MKAIDYESYLIGNGSIFPKPVCLSAYDGSQTFLFNRADTEAYLKENINKHLIVAHNAVFECGVTVTHYPQLAEQVFEALDNGLIYCTKINEALWNVQREKPLNKLSLADLVQHYFSKDISDTKTDPEAWRLRYSELDDIPISEWPETARQYAIDDSIWAYKIKKCQKYIDQTLTLKSAVYLNLQGATGFTIDPQRVNKLEEEIWEYLTPRYDFLVQEGFCDYMPKQKKPRKQVKKIKEYIESLNLELMYTDKGSTATSAEALSFYNNQIDDKVLKVYSELSKYETILSTYVNNIKGNDIIYSQYSTTLNTGRTSSSKSKLFSSCNIQNVPRKVDNVTYDVRNCFVARPGFKICSIDYSGLELCSAAHQLYTTLGYSQMRAALNEGDKPTDMHSKLAAKIKGINYEEFILNKQAFKEDRQKAKPINLGFPGGIGYDTMRYLMWKDGITTRYEILERAARKTDLYYYLTMLAAPDIRIKRTGKYEYSLVQDELILLKKYMFELYPDLEQFLKDTHNRFLTGKHKHVKNDFGEWEDEPMYSYSTHGFKRDWCTYTALCNGFLMQTPSAIGAKNAMCKLIREFYNHPDVIPQAFIHDEAVVEVREDKTEEHLKRISEILIDGMHEKLPSVRMTVEAEVCGPYWRKSGGEWSKTYWKNEPKGDLLE
jgi:DNA polymerase I-like protein with 3'-5' exonuclease and polymerase domains